MPRTAPQVDGQEYVLLETLQPSDTPASAVQSRSLNIALHGGNVSAEALFKDHHIVTADMNSSTGMLLSPGAAPAMPDQEIPPSGITSRTPSDPPRTFKPLKSSSPFNLSDWKWEFAAATFSLICSVSIIGILVGSQNKTLLSWQFMFGITLNTLVAILSTLSRAALLVPIASGISQLKWMHFVGSAQSLHEFQVFDDASRGPWGSLTLIRTLRLRTKLAAWGSFITILTLAIGPFTQQLLSYPTRLTQTPGASFYVGQVYDTGTLSNRPCKQILNMIRAEQALRIQPNILTSLLDPQPDLEIERAISRVLYNMSMDIKFECPSGHCLWDDITTLAVSSTCQNVTSDPRTKKVEQSGIYHYKTPSGIEVGVRYQTSNKGVSVMNYNSSARTYSSANDGELRNSTIASFAMVQRRQLPKGWMYEITECEIRWCARTIKNTTAINGTLLLGQSMDFELTKITNPVNKENGISFTVSEDSFPFPGNRTFFVSSADNFRIMSYLERLFSLNDSDTLGAILAVSENLMGTVKAISVSMSYAVGQIRSAIVIEGQSAEQFIQVNWIWITLPLAEVAMGIGFLVCTVIHAKREGVIVWKSSSIAAFLTSMDGWDGDNLRADSWREIEKRSKGLHGRLIPSRTGVQYFRRTEK